MNLDRHRQELSSIRASVYASEVMPVTPRLASQLDREPHSVSHGSFDREHWSWKFRDYPLAMLQTSVYPLALLWRLPFPGNAYYENQRVLEWISGVIERTLTRQHRNGAIDAFCPNEYDPGSTLGVIHGLSEAFCLIRPAITATREALFLGALRKACDFCLFRDEGHGFVSNHWALFAVTFLTAHELLGDAKYHARAEELIARILREQSPDGWYREYDGPDPGYESLGIFHLATYWQRTGSSHVLHSLRRSVEFYAHCVHPDGSVGGVYGSRHTGLYFPAGFEILGREIPMAAVVARHMRERLGRGNVVTPAVIDTANMPSLLYTYLEACRVVGDEPSVCPPLPCEALQGIRHFPDSAITVVGREQYYAVTNASKGGVCRIFDKRTGTIAYEDAGYLVRTGGRRWASQFIGLGQRVHVTDGNVVVSATSLAKVRQEQLTPLRFMLLRLLNLTLFRSPAFAGRLRRAIIARLSGRKRPGPLRLKRSVTFGPSEVRFQDRLELIAPIPVDDVTLPRAFVAIHTGSAKYFHRSELEVTPQPPTSEMAENLNRNRAADCAFTLHFSPATLPEFTADPTRLGPGG